MPEQVFMPRLSDTMTSGTVSKWLKHPGDDVKKGEPLVEIETDKANIELEAYASGKLARIVLQEGQSAPVGDLIGEIALAGEDASASTPSHAAAEGRAGGNSEAVGAPAEAKSAETPGGAVATTDAKRPEPTQKQAEAAAPTAQGSAEAAPEPHGQVRASPMARRIARELGVDLSAVKGSGPLGRIQKEDVEAAAKAGPQAQPAAGADTEVVQLSRMQQTIARRMVEAKASAPHFYVSMDVDMGRAAGVLEDLNDGVEHDQVVTINDLILRACALALRDYPDVNASFRDGAIVRNRRINVGFAVAVQGGLVEPIIRDADQKGLRQIAAETKTLARKVREGKVELADYEGGTFSISNLGMYGVTEFAAIINPPHSAILAVGAAEDRPVVVDGQLAVGKRCTLTLSADHRVFYGATAAEFLRAVKHKLEKPFQLFT
jgi:pyruvate dehydrogenase E2 component (dihydrolipoamide acetyltransferase)